VVYPLQLFEQNGMVASDNDQVGYCILSGAAVMNEYFAVNACHEILVYKWQ